MRRRRLHSLLTLSTLCWLTSATALPKADWGLCPSVAETQLPPLAPLDGPGLVQISADRISSDQADVSTLEGRVEVRQNNLSIEAERATFSRRTNELTLEGDVRYRFADTLVTGERAEINLLDDSGELQSTRFFFSGFHAFGEADTIRIDPDSGHSLDGVRYTTCAPADPAWLLSARRLTLDELDNVGEAYGVVLRFQGVPFVYLPYINFPLRGRKSGLLPPTVGITSDGADISVPIYWNIAPDRDATLTPRYIEQRGNLLGAEFRYLNPTNSGELSGEFIAGDDIYGDDRYAASYRHDGTPRPGWQTTIRYAEVSDVSYYSDMGSSQALGSTTHLERLGEVSYISRQMDFAARVQDWQTLSGVQPYDRLPELRLGLNQPYQPGHLQFAVAASAAAFDHRDAVTTGNRFIVEPSVRWPWRGDGWFIEPSASWHHTTYQLESPGGSSTTVSRNLPRGTVDSGLIFVRPFSALERNWQQTLEPRLYLQTIPYQDQSALPLFDTAAYEFTYDQLFSANRFSGPDRIGDGRFISIGLSSRLIDTEEGDERIRGAIGQSFYLNDRRVTLPAASADTRTTSDLIAELELRPNQRFDARGALRWNPQQNWAETASFRLRYASGSQRQVGIGYSEWRNGQRQGDITALWPLSGRWQLLGRWHYDLRFADTLETIAGVEYQSCCWGMRVVGKTQRDPATGKTERSFFLTLELKGLTTLGRGLGDELEAGLLTNP